MAFGKEGGEWTCPIKLAFGVNGCTVTERPYLITAFPFCSQLLSTFITFVAESLRLSICRGNWLSVVGQPVQVPRPGLAGAAVGS